MNKFLLMVSMVLTLSCGGPARQALHPLKDKYVSYIAPTLPVEPKISTHVEWRKPSKDTIKEGVDRDKYILILFTQSWCGWCKELLKTMDTPEVAVFINTNFVPVLIEGADDEIVKEALGKDEVSYPTVVFISPQKELTVQMEGLGSSSPRELMMGLMKVLEIKEQRDLQRGKKEKEESTTSL